ncbi:MAG: hypothetical protein FD163_1910 [Hyphomonadaceae bacterium]|nr:MAG: hypothetical protein FD128_1404 [Hyphomonadaceae bacterium]KAF0184336.1 MAG: hypothetical protein FD163_1910 [Hyphomonadaceae bacterium]
MKFEWDASKNAANIAKHGISFEEAYEIFNGPIYSKADERNNYGEHRFVSIGEIGFCVVIVVVHTDRHEKTRIISARLANKIERRLYNDNIKRTN